MLSGAFMECVKKTTSICIPKYIKKILIPKFSYHYIMIVWIVWTHV